MESVLSTGCLDSGQDVTDLLVTVEKAIMLIGPQLKHNLTKLDTTQTGKCAQSHTSVLPQIILADFNMFVGTLLFLISWLHNQVEAEIAVHRGKTPPTGPIHLSTENATVTTDWTTAAGTGVYAGNPPVFLSPWSSLQTCSKSNLLTYIPLWQVSLWLHCWAIQTSTFQLTAPLKSSKDTTRTGRTVFFRCSPESYLLSSPTRWLPTWATLWSSPSDTYR